MWGAKQTRTGRVVYRRKKHFFEIGFLKRLGDLIIEIDERTFDDEVAHHALSINYCYQVLSHTLFARAYSYLHPTQTISWVDSQGGHRDIDVYTVIRAILWELWQKMFQELSKLIMEKFGVPSSVADLIIEYSWEPIMTIIEGTLGRIFFKEEDYSAS
jgi:hypothetical protein